MFNYARAAEDLRSRGFAPGIITQIHDYEVLSKNVASVICSMSDMGSDRAARMQAVSKTLQGKATPIAYRLRQFAGDGMRPEMPMIKGFVTPTRVIEEYTKDRVSRMTHLSSNILMDEDDKNIWNVTNVNGKKFLSRNVDENLSELLASSVSKSVNTMKLKSFASIQPQTHEMVAFVDPKKAIIRYGMCVGSKILATDTSKLIAVDPQYIVEICTEDKENLPEIKEVKAASKQDLIKYYTEVYNYDAEYLKKFINEINNHAAL